MKIYEIIVKMFFVIVVFLSGSVIHVLAIDLKFIQWPFEYPPNITYEDYVVGQQINFVSGFNPFIIGSATGGNNSQSDIIFNTENDRTQEYKIFPNIAISIHLNYLDTINRTNGSFALESDYLKYSREHIFQNSSIFTHFEVAYKF